MRDIQSEKKSEKSISASTTASSTSTAVSSTSTKSSTRRRVANKELSTVKIMQKHDMVVEVRFD